MKCQVKSFKTIRVAWVFEEKRKRYDNLDMSRSESARAESAEPGDRARAEEITMRNRLFSWSETNCLLGL